MTNTSEVTRLFVFRNMISNYNLSHLVIDENNLTHIHQVVFLESVSKIRDTGIDSSCILILSIQCECSLYSPLILLYC